MADEREVLSNQQERQPFARQYIAEQSAIQGDDGNLGQTDAQHA